MTTPDLINGLSAFTGSLFIFNHCVVLRDHRQTGGVSALSVSFFTAWALFGVFYLIHLDQFFSALGSAAMFFADALWLYLILFYRRHPDTATRSPHSTVPNDSVAWDYGTIYDRDYQSVFLGRRNYRTQEVQARRTSNDPWLRLPPVLWPAFIPDQFQP